VFTTPHIGAATREAQLKVAIELVEQVIDDFVRNVVRNAVNLPRMQEKEQEELWPFVMLARTVGDFAGRFHDGTLREITVTYYGPQFDAESVKMVTNAALKGVLSAAIESPITLVNASMVATERGLKVREVFKKKTTDFARALSVQVTGDRDTHDIQGALFGDSDIRLVKIDGYRLEAVPEGALLITQNVDVPGIIGKVGTILGKASVNISRMQVSLNRTASNAAMAIWSLDEPAPEEVLKNIGGLENIDSCKQITL
jgi:D-3-phosphoglycerate dehydrogenase